MIAGGVGITPMMSMVRTAADRRDPRRTGSSSSPATARTCCSATSSASCADDLDLEVTEVLRRPHRRLGRAPPARSTSGCSTAVLGGEHDPAQLDYFLCGPPGLIHDTLEALDALGVPEHRVHTEQFDMA